MVFLVAFAFRRTHAPVWWYGIALAGSVGGNLVGAAIAPRLRARVREEWILVGSVLAVAAVGFLTIPVGLLQRRPATSLLAVTVGLAAGTAKLAFDSLVQQDVPAASHGRAFGRLEAAFQLVWVLGGLVPVLIVLSLRAGNMIVTATAVGAAIVYLVANRLAGLDRLPHWWPGVAHPAGPSASPSPVIGGAVGQATPATTVSPQAADPTLPEGSLGSTVDDPDAAGHGGRQPGRAGRKRRKGDPAGPRGQRPPDATNPGLARPPRLGPPPPLDQ
jgi:hypothetical protein